MATPRWIGNAVDIAQVDTITVGGAWLATETLTLTINSKTITATVGSGTTSTDNVATLIRDAINGDSPTTGTVDVDADDLGEFAELVATVDASVVTVTTSSNYRGVPFTLSVAESSTSGTLTPSTDTAATGKNHFDDADNWSTGSVPADGDTVIFDHGAVDCLYGLAQSDITPAALIITSAYTGKIGLAARNSNGYNEYRDTYLQLGNAVDATTITVTIGQGNGSGSSRLNLDFGDSNFVASIFRTGARILEGVPPCLIKGTHTDFKVNVIRGDVGLGFYEGDTTNGSALNIGYIDFVDDDARVECGPGFGTGLDTLEMIGGFCSVDAAGATCVIDMQGGTLALLSGAWGTANVGGNKATGTKGTLVYHSTGTLTTLRVRNNGVADFDQSVGTKTVTNTHLYAGAAYYDRLEQVNNTNDFELEQCGIEDVDIQAGKGRTWRRV